VDSPSETEVWWGRFEATGRAQGRYLYVLGFTCVFYAMVWHETVRGQLVPGLHPGSVEIPILKFSLYSLPLLRTAPLVLSLTLMAVLGSMKACGEALRILESLRSETLRRAFDKTPNFLDMVMYPGDSPNKLARVVTWLVYPILFVIAYLEAGVLACLGFNARVESASPWEMGVLWVGIVAMIAALPRLATVVCKRIANAWRTLFPSDKQEASEDA
jgi:hypothetical protein